MTEVKVGLRAVVGDKNLTVLERAHRARVDVYIGIELDVSDRQPSRFEQSTRRCCDNAFTNG